MHAALGKPQLSAHLRDVQASARRIQGFQNCERSLDCRGAGAELFIFVISHSIGSSILNGFEMKVSRTPNDQRAAIQVSIKAKTQAKSRHRRSQDTGKAKTQAKQLTVRTGNWSRPKCAGDSCDTSLPHSQSRMCAR